MEFYVCANTIAPRLSLTADDIAKETSLILS